MFVDGSDLADGYFVAGRYKAAGGTVTVTATLFRGEDKVGPVAAAGPKEKPDELAAKLAAEVQKLLKARR